jgi:hypothetical protein
MPRSDDSKCCGARAGWSSRWDRFFCTVCQAWTSPRCNCGPDDDCPFAGDCPPTAEGIVDERDTPSSRVIEVEYTAEELRAKQEAVARDLGLTVAELYERVDAGAYDGKIIEAELHMLRFLLEG